MSKLNFIQMLMKRSSRIKLLKTIYKKNMRNNYGFPYNTQSSGSVGIFNKIILKFLSRQMFKQRRSLMYKTEYMKFLHFIKTINSQQ